MNGDNEASRYRIDAVVKAMRLLGAFAAPPHRFTLTELSVRSELSKNQAFRLLQTLADTGFVQQGAETKTYRLGARAFQLVGALQGSDELLLAAGAVLDWVRDETGETVNLVAPAGDGEAICVDKRESRRPLQISARVGARFALHAGASPKLLLAFRDDAAITHYLERHGPLPRYTPATITEPAMLRAELARIREQGFAVSDEDLDLGACAVSAPIRDRRGAIVAGVSVAAPAARFGPPERKRYRAIAVEAGERISQGLGYVVQPKLIER